MNAGVVFIIRTVIKLSIIYKSITIFIHLLRHPLQQFNNTVLVPPYEEAALFSVSESIHQAINHSQRCC